MFAVGRYGNRLLSPLNLCWPQRCGPVRLYSIDKRASSKLWADAENEELTEQQDSSNPTTRLSAQQTEQNWTGDEPIQDAVLRMLVDKYKPLRTSGVRTAEEKLKDAPPAVSNSMMSSSMTSEGNVYGTYPGSVVQPSLMASGSVEHKPWLVTFKPPSHAINVRLGRIPPVTARKSELGDNDGKKRETAARKRGEVAQRLGRARESMLDYKLGLKGPDRTTSTANADMAGQRRSLPVSTRGLAGLVEERIQRAQQEGLFRDIKGRGKPFAQETAEGNPFIAREEFLMNRIVQRNGATPPWVDLQGELEDALQSFRSVLTQSWSRRAIRMLTLSRPHSSLTALTLEDCRALRDREWETREQAYHDAALKEVNELVRRYNALAPYPVRRRYHERNVELLKAYEEAAEVILRTVKQHALADNSRGTGSFSVGHGDDEKFGGESGGASVEALDGQKPLGFWQAIRDWFTQRRQ